LLGSLSTAESVWLDDDAADDEADDAVEAEEAADVPLCNAVDFLTAGALRFESSSVVHVSCGQFLH
jgi:hypothetical protein